MKINSDLIIGDNNYTLKDVDNFLYKQQWSYLGTKTGRVEMDLPKDFNELYIIVTRDSGRFWIYSMPKLFLTLDYKSFINGDCITQQYNAGACAVDVSLTKIRLRYVYINGENDKTAVTDWFVYYR